MTGMDLDPQHWVPLPRRGARAATAIRRLPDDEALALSADEIAAVADGGPTVTRVTPASATTKGRAAVRFWHRAPTAGAVALAASGWWLPTPVDACDLRRVAGGWWTLAVDVPDDWQVSYRFVEHRGGGDPRWWEHGLRDPGGTAVPDATHPLRHAAGRGAESSVLRLPAAHRDWLSGTATEEPGACRPAGSPWQCWSWVTPAPPGTDLPLLVITDGRAHVEQLGTHCVLQAAVAAGELPPLAVLFVDSGPDRAGDLGVPGGQARWIGEALVPALREEGLRGPRLTSDAHRTLVAGSSFGGLTALFAVARAPGTIGAAIVQSPSLWRYRERALVEPLLDADRRHPLRLRLQAGTEEGLVPAAAALAADLGEGGVDADFAPRSGGHDWAWWVPGIVEAAADLLGPTRPSG